MLRRLRKMLAGRQPVMLMYHRVIELAEDPWGLAVAPDHFDAQLAALKRARTVLPADDFVARWRTGMLPGDAVAITFDDGYLDNLRGAAPLLAAHGLPATLFLATHSVRRTTPYWYDQLTGMILDAADPVDVRIALPDGDWTVRLGAREARDDDRGEWRAWDPPRTERERVYHATWDRLRRLDPPDTEAAIVALAARLPGERRDADRPMTAAEVRELAAHGAFTLGGHTRDHPDLLELSDDDALAQMVEGKAEAEALGGAPVAGFAYPYGRYDRRVRNLVERAGFGWACTTEHGGVGRGADALTLPRVTPENVPHIDWLE